MRDDRCQIGDGGKECVCVCVGGGGGLSAFAARPSSKLTFAGGISPDSSAE